MKHKLLYLLSLSALFPGLTACTTVYQQERPFPDRVPYYAPIPAYSEYDYYFYPNVAVYFQISTGFYFYEDHGHWYRVRQLPPSIHLDSRYRRQLIIRDSYPYMRYSEHARLYGAREDDHDRRDDRRPEQNIRPDSPDSDRQERESERPVTEERQYRPFLVVPTPEEQQEPPPAERRGKDLGGAGRVQDDDRRAPKTQSPARDDDKSQTRDREPAPEGRPDARRPSRDNAPPKKAHARGERDQSKDAAPAGKADESPKHDSGKQEDEGSAGRQPGSRDDDDADREHQWQNRNSGM